MQLSPLREKVLSTLKPEERDFMTRVCCEIENSEIEKGLPVLYPGSGGDVTHAVLLGDNLVFVDSHQPETTVSEILSEIAHLGGEILEEDRTGIWGKGGKLFIKFRLEGEKINLTYYAQDATKLHELDLEELENGYSVYFVKVPLPKEISVGSLRSPSSLGKALQDLAVGGFYLERECPLPSHVVSEMGFTKIVSGNISGLSVHPEKGNLYHKVEQVDNIIEILEAGAAELYFQANVEGYSDK
ncbi:MAG: hypothetical protein R6U44_03085 [Archaeoglobaceae archaeon]